MQNPGTKYYAQLVKKGYDHLLSPVSNLSAVSVLQTNGTKECLI